MLEIALALAILQEGVLQDSSAQFFLFPRATLSSGGPDIRSSKASFPRDNPMDALLRAVAKSIRSEKSPPPDRVLAAEQRLSRMGAEDLARLQKPDQEVGAIHVGFLQTSYEFAINGKVLGLRIPLYEIQRHSGIIDIFRGYWVANSDLHIRIFMAAGVRIRYKASGGEHLFGRIPFTSATVLGKRSEATIPKQWRPKRQVLIEFFGLHPSTLPANSPALFDRFKLVPSVRGQNIQDVVAKTVKLCRENFETWFGSDLQYVEPVYLAASPQLARYYLIESGVRMG
jgi:hypothetical protein